MTEPRPTVSDLVTNARQHLEQLSEKLVDVLADVAGAGTVAPMLESLQGDLDAIERLQSDIQCNLHTEADRM